MPGPTLALGVAALLCLLLTLAALPLMRAACRQRVSRAHLPEPPKAHRDLGGPRYAGWLSDRDRSRAHRIKG